ncbi:DUF3489 domain-containing protein [Pandoraea cepalis]|uniref:DUF3489 domain-containing protein n=1 Tax=Pandoraea cepalis TaxID=2508294 RepID=UPI003F5C3591
MRRRLDRHAQATGGAMIAQICKVTGWQPHTVFGTFAGAFKKKLRLTVLSEKVEGCGRAIGLSNNTLR